MNTNILGMLVVLLSLLLFSLSIEVNIVIVDYLVLFLIDTINFVFGVYVGTRHEK